MAAAFGGSGDKLDELESHLREEIDHLMQAGHTADAAFMAAIAKLGRPADLAAEYSRVAPPIRWLPIPIGAALLLVLFCWYAWMFVSWQLRGTGVVLSLHVVSLLSGYSLCFFAGLLGICYIVCWIVRPIGLGQRRSLRRTLIVANAGAAILLLVGMVLGSVWAHQHLGHAWNNDPREIGTSMALLWFTLLTALLWIVPQKQHLSILLSVFGISVGVAGWSGPTLFIEQGHRHSSSVAFWLVVLMFTIMPVVVAGLGLLPPARLRRQLT